MKKPITLDGILYYYEIKISYDYNGYPYYYTSLFKAPIKRIVKRRKLIKRGALGLIGNKYKSEEVEEDYYECCGSIQLNIENTSKYTKEQCIDKLRALLPKSYA